MSDQTWKAWERRIARRLGGRRIPVTGERDGADVAAGQFVYQAKLGRRMPGYLRTWLRGIVGAGARQDPPAIGAVVWKPPAGLDHEAVVLLRLCDWEELHGPWEG